MASVATGGESGSSFTFTQLKEALPAFESSDAQDSLQRWNLLPFMRTAAFRFDQPFTPEQTDAFLIDFFGAAAVQEAAPVCTNPGQWGALGSIGTGAVKYARLPTTVLRLDFFDRLKDAGIVRMGDIAKCFDVQCGEGGHAQPRGSLCQPEPAPSHLCASRVCAVLVSDRLRKLLLDDSSEEWELFSAAEREELIFHVLRRLAIGGGMNQYEDSIEPYLKLTKAAYKDLVTVNKSAGGALQVSSLTFAVESVAGGSASLFPRPSPHNFCYVVVDPVARRVKLWYAAFFPMM